MYEYDREFYRYISRGSVLSARRLLPLLSSRLPLRIGSVLDVGCGAGAWLSVWKQQGAAVLGLDGDYVDREELLIDTCEFFPCDLTTGFNLERQFDLVQCLEVAEHLPGQIAPLLVQNLCKHSDLVLFSAAAPGQGGENHINEQPYAYWRNLFSERGYRAYDPVRQDLCRDPEVMPWYRYNSFLYVSEHASQALHEALAPFQVDPMLEPADISPKLYQFRKAIVRLLPSQTSTLFAVAKKTLFNIRLRARRTTGSGQS
jgi:SAM-dependent methyltransferase